MDIHNTSGRKTAGAVAVLIGKNPKWTLIRLSTLIIGSVVFIKLFTPIRVTGVSMFPAYKDGRINFINRAAFAKEKPKRFDVVGVRIKEGSLLLKRVVALPGETAEIRHGKVYINGELLEEPNVKARQPWQVTPLALGENEYLLIGDNRAMSQLEHTFGIFSREQILGKVLF